MSLEVVNNFSTADPQVSNQFFQQYYLGIMQDVFFVLTDTDHKSGFKLQSMVLARLFQLVQTGAIGVPLFDPSTVPDPNMSNSLFLQEYTATLLKNAFPHLQPYAQSFVSPFGGVLTISLHRIQVTTFVRNLAEYHSDINKFKLSLRDFLVQLKEFAGDNTELYLEEKETEAQMKAQEEREAAMKIPGMLKPSQIQDHDEEL